MQLLHKTIEPNAAVLHYCANEGIVMLNISATYRNIGTAVAFASVIGFAPVPANAANFFEQLFGGAPQGQSEQMPAQAPSLDFSAPSDAPSITREHHHRRVAAIVHAEPVRQKTTDLMHDKTLQYGDAVVTKTGIEVYAGAESGRHTMRQFVALDDADMSAKEKDKLVAMDSTRVDPLANAPLREGRSSSESLSRPVLDSLPITKGYKVTDATGKSVRYVGP